MTTPTTPPLSTRQRNAVAFICANPRARQPEIAAAVGVSDRTLRSWQLQPHYVAALDEATQASAAAARGMARRLHNRVIEELAALAFDDPAATVRLRACCALLDHLHQHDLDEIAARLDALEAHQQHGCAP